MDDLKKEVEELYKKIGLDQNGQSINRPPKDIVRQKQSGYGYAWNSSAEPPSHLIPRNPPVN